MGKALNVVCFGEILLRLGAEGGLLLQTPALRAHVGGAEANVAVSLARFGAHARMASIVPDNALGRAAIGELRRNGVDTQLIQTGPGRMGLYFLTPGAGRRPADILYDRGHSAFAEAAADAIDWPAALEGADWLHISGVTAAVSPAAGIAARAALEAARANGVKVAFDANYRAKLWERRRETPSSVLRPLFAGADLLFANGRDIAMVLEQPQLADAPAAEAAFAAFPQLARMACTVRKIVSGDHHVLTGHSFTRDGATCAHSNDIPGIVDRIGAGDAFAAAVLLGHAYGRADASILEFAMAATVLKHYIPGDFNLTSHEDVQAFMLDQTCDVRR